MCTANEKQCYNVTLSLIGWAHAQNDPCDITITIIDLRSNFGLRTDIPSLVTRFVGPIWGPPGAARTQVGTMLATQTLLSGLVCHQVVPCEYLWETDQVIARTQWIMAITSHYITLPPPLPHPSTLTFSCAIYLHCTQLYTWFIEMNHDAFLHFVLESPAMKGVGDEGSGVGGTSFWH